MKKFTIVSIFVSLMALSAFAQSAESSAVQEAKVAAQEEFAPSSTHCFAQRDTTKLYLDIYEPAPGSATTLDGKTKPTILFVFGGGFISGTRNEKSYKAWFKQLTDNGYRVVANDYRLGLKGVSNVGIMAAKAVHKAIDIAVEDLLDATAYLVNHAQELGIEPDNIVVSGSSAGAITSLQAEWYLSNAHPMCKVLPDGFHYAGVMSFAGAIFSDSGRVRYNTTPAPMLLLHGTADKIVNFKQVWFFNLRFAGSNVLLRKTLKPGDYNYNYYQFETYGHEIASEMRHQFAREIQFLEDNVIRGKKVIVEASVTDLGIPRFKGMSTRKDLY